MNFTKTDERLDTTPPRAGSYDPFEGRSPGSLRALLRLRDGVMMLVQPVDGGRLGWQARAGPLAERCVSTPILVRLHSVRMMRSSRGAHNG